MWVVILVQPGFCFCLHIEEKWGGGGGGGGASCSSVDFVFVCTLLVIIGGSCHKYHSCHDKSFVTTNVFVMANMCLS